MNISRDDLLWLAGLCEGEATFDLHRGKYPRIRLGMTDRDVIGRAATLIGSRVRASLHGKPAQATWHTEVSGTRAVEVMRALLPHMGSRRSGKIATVLGHASLPHASSSAPGPRLTRPPGLPEAVPAAA
ncbi:hypothetical protein [Cellulosimicrobium sp. TH-20]|uniref:hypothetical protein n=1 Tax=Cellulosimicrobium sp. TH-20 TaxID=1980001 RepID=UPI0011A97388|nr:hypothetical protein [Cellulosimicrobium sp. TH-20]